MVCGGGGASVWSGEIGWWAVVDIFDEINEDLRAEKAQALLRRFAPVLVGIVVLVIAGVGGWQWWRAHRTGQAEAVATRYMDAAAKVGRAPDEALAGFGALAADGPEGYRSLARLRAAALMMGKDRGAALALLDQVSADTAAEPALRGLADLLWVQANVDAGDPAAVEGRLAALLQPEQPWRALAMEAQALLFLRTGRATPAREVLKQLVGNAAATPALQSRAALLLEHLSEMTPGAGG